MTSMEGSKERKDNFHVISRIWPKSRSNISPFQNKCWRKLREEIFEKCICQYIRVNYIGFMGYLLAKLGYFLDIRLYCKNNFPKIY